MFTLSIEQYEALDKVTYDDYKLLQVTLIDLEGLAEHAYTTNDDVMAGIYKQQHEALKRVVQFLDVLYQDVNIEEWQRDHLVEYMEEV